MNDASTVLGVDDRVAFFENYFCSHGAKDRARETKSPYGMGAHESYIFMKTERIIFLK